MTNYYPELPEQPYKRTSVRPTPDAAMKDVVAYLRSADLPLEVKRAVYIVFRMESGNGVSGVNNNYAGFQADSGRWKPPSIDHYFTGTASAVENRTGNTRIFLCFSSWQDCVECLAEVLAARGLYVGGTTNHITHLDVTDATMLARAYQKEWASGSATAEPSPAVLGNFLSMYAQATGEGILPASLAPSVAPVPPTPPAVPEPAPAVPRPSFSVTLAENTRLRAAITDAMATLQAALNGPSLADNSSDDLNAEQLARMDLGE